MFVRLLPPVRVNRNRKPESAIGVTKKCTAISVNVNLIYIVVLINCCVSLYFGGVNLLRIAKRMLFFVAQCGRRNAGYPLRLNKIRGKKVRLRGNPV